MIQEELVNTISERAGISRQTVREIIEVIGQVWSEEVLLRGELDLENVGEFFVDHRPGRKGVNTETKEIFVVPPKDFLQFVPSRDLVEWSNRLS